MPYAVITGATQGIGRAVAEKLLQEGFSVIICARTESDLSRLKTEWQQQYPLASIATVIADLGEQEAVHDFGLRVLEITKTIDILVNNAGIFLPGELATEPEGHLEQLMQVNVYAAYHLTRALLPLMKEQRAGHIFNLCSVASLRAYPNGGAYSITKYALLGFSENLRYELMPHGIKVTAICPGATWSGSWSGSDVKQERIMEAADVAQMLWASYNLSARAVVETIIMRPLKGDL